MSKYYMKFKVMPALILVKGNYTKQATKPLDVYPDAESAEEIKRKIRKHAKSDLRAVNKMIRLLYQEKTRLIKIIGI